MVRDTLIDFFDDLSRARGRFLVHDDGFRSRAYSYAEIARGARGFAADLHDAGARAGDNVVFWSENRPEWIVAFWGCLLCGAVVVPIDYRASPDFLARVARIVSAKIVLIGQDVPPFTTPIDAPGWKPPQPHPPDAPPPPPPPRPPRAVLPDLALDGDEVREHVAMRDDDALRIAGRA